MPTASGSPRRRWYQFSLLTLLLSSAFLAALLGSGLIWWQWPYQVEELVVDSVWNYEALLEREERILLGVPDTACIGIAPEPSPRYTVVYHAYRILRGSEVKHGLLTVYDLDGKKLREENWRHGKLHGKWTDWHPDGSVLADGEYHDGERHGPWRRYEHDVRKPGNSTLRYVETFHNGMLTRHVHHGRIDCTVTEYDANGSHVTVWNLKGQKLEERTYRLKPATDDGTGDESSERELVISGLLRRWYSTGARKEEENYVDGQRTGEARGWYESGPRAYEGTWRNDREHRVWTWYQEDDSVDFRREFREGRLVDWNGKLFPDIEQRLIGKNDAPIPIVTELGRPTLFVFKDTPLIHVGVFLTDLHGLHIKLDARAFEAANIMPEEVAMTSFLTPWTARLGGMSLRAALQIALEPHNLAPVVRHGMLLITTREDADSWQDCTGVRQIIGNRLSPFVAEFEKPTQFQFHETPLKDVCRFISDLHGIRVQLEPEAENELADTPITLYLSGVSLAGGLAFILDQHGLCCVETPSAVLIRPLERPKK
jgi:antitoxin component YwqK of YwqJK toxin-antitoxin module